MAIRNLITGLAVIIAGSLLGLQEGHARPPSASKVNSAPTISGVAPTTVIAGSAYAFLPTAADPDGQRLRFSITNKPAWAKFEASTGRISGTPTSANLGTVSNIVVNVTDGALSAALAPFSITVSGGQNRAPTISGAPASSATVGVAYAFAPTAADPDGDSMSWSITAKPAGATFNVATGQLIWTPTAAGTWANIVITVTDARGASASLPAFAITVSTAAAPSGTASLTWVAPTQYTDGSGMPGTDLAAFRIYGGSTAASLARIAELDGRAQDFTVQNLGTGTHYFAITAVTLAGTESALSEVKSKTFP
jgi:hypothetical protein